MTSVCHQTFHTELTVFTDPAKWRIFIEPLVRPQSNWSGVSKRPLHFSPNFLTPPPNPNCQCRRIFGSRTGNRYFSFPLAGLRRRRSSCASSKRVSERDSGRTRDDAGRQFLSKTRPNSLRSLSDTLRLVPRQLLDGNGDCECGLAAGRRCRTHSPVNAVRQSRQQQCRNLSRI
jgi:hypothetical protein